MIRIRVQSRVVLGLGFRVRVMVREPEPICIPRECTYLLVNFITSYLLVSVN